MLRALFLLTALFGLAACSNMPVATYDSTENALLMNYETMTLDNGLNVVFHVDRSDPVVAVILTAHVGSARELEGRTGFAHLFEHLLFLESENLGKGGLDAMSARIGGSGANGSTSRDSTDYFQVVPKNALEKMLWAEADKLGYFINTVSAPVLAKEKQVVKNEKRQGVDNVPYGHTHYVIDKNLYPQGHPYNWQVIGSLEDLQNATLDDVKQFFKRWYVPNNVNLVISGDIDVDQAKQWVYQYFDEIPRGDEVVPNEAQSAQLAHSKRLVYEDNFASVPQLTVTWPTVPMYDDDSYALATLRRLLAEGKRSPLNRVLIDEQKLTSHVLLTDYDSELAGQTYLQVRAFKGVALDAVFEGVEQAFDRFEKRGFSDADLARVKAQQETEFYRGLSSALGKGFYLANYQTFLGEPGFAQKDLAKTLAVSKDDIWRVYKRYIKDKPYVATSFVPKGEGALALSDSVAAKVFEEKIVMGAEEEFDASKSLQYQITPSSFDRSVEPPYSDDAIAVTMPDVHIEHFDNGLSLYSIHDEEVPLVNFSLFIKGGVLFERPEEAGITRLLASVLNRGTRDKTPQEFEEALAALGAKMTVSATKTGLVVSGSALAKHYASTMRLLTEMLLAPRFDSVEFELAKQRAINVVRQRASSATAIADDTFPRLLYGENSPLALSGYGSLASLEALSLASMRGYYQRYVAPGLSSMHVTGAVTARAVSESLTELKENWRTSTPVLPEIVKEHSPKKAKVYFYDVPGARQSVLRIGAPAMDAGSKNYYPARVMNYRLGGGGFASILTQQLREAKGYTYGIRSAFEAGDQSGLFSIGSNVRANVTLESLQLIKSIAENYGGHFTENDLDLTKSYFEKSTARRFETPEAKLAYLFALSQYAWPTNYVDRHAEVLNAMTVAKVKQLAAYYLRPDEFVYLVVGDAQTQLQRLDALGLGVPVRLN